LKSLESTDLAINWLGYHLFLIIVRAVDNF